MCALCVCVLSVSVCSVCVCVTCTGFICTDYTVRIYDCQHATIDIRIYYASAHLEPAYYLHSSYTPPPLPPPTLPHPPYYSGDKKEKSPNPDPVDSTQLSRRLISYIAGILECSLIGEDATVRRHPRLLHLRSRSDQDRAPKQS